MAIPKQNQFNQSVLEIAAEDGGVLSYGQLIASLKQRHSLTDGDMQKLISKGRNQTAVYINTTWAAGELKRAGLLDSPNRGRFQINAKGREYLRTKENTSTSSLRKLRSFLESQQNDSEEGSSPNLTIVSDDPEVAEELDANPDEQIVEVTRELEIKLEDDMLATLKDLSNSPDQFEQVVVDLLSEMGYGEGRRVGRSGDGGVDGVIYQDPLELELDKQIYIQAKCWKGNPVRVGDIRAFSGSLGSKGVTKGVFITTSRFTKDAMQAASDALRDNKIIRLIDGQELSRLMIDNNVGVVPETTYVIKKLDENYFADEI